MEDGRIPKDILYGELASGKRPRGRYDTKMSANAISRPWTSIQRVGRKLRPTATAGDNRDFKIPGRLTSRTVILGAEDWTETDVLGGKLSTVRSGLLERRTATNLKFLALFVNHGIF